MKSIYSLIVTASIALPLLCSCGPKVVQKSSNISFDSLSYDTATAIYNGTDTLSATVHIQLLTAKGSGADAINDSILSSVLSLGDIIPQNQSKEPIKNKVKAFSQKFITQYQRDCKEAQKANCLGASFQYSFDVESSVESISDSIAVYHAETFVFMGGAHGSNILTIRNINTKTGRILEKKDIFKANSDSELVQLICQDLMKRFNVKKLNALQEKGVFMDTKPYVPRNFILKADSITFVYQQDEISPHALGVICATISRRDLSKYMK